MILSFYLNCRQQLSPPPHQHKSTKHTPNTIIMSQSSLLAVRYTQVINKAVAKVASKAALDEIVSELVAHKKNHTGKETGGEGDKDKGKE